MYIKKTNKQIKHKIKKGGRERKETNKNITTINNNINKNTNNKKQE